MLRYHAAGDDIGLLAMGHGNATEQEKIFFY